MNHHDYNVWLKGVHQERTTTIGIAHHRPFSMGQKSFNVLFKPLFYHKLKILSVNTLFPYARNFARKRS